MRLAAITLVEPTEPIRSNVITTTHIVPKHSGHTLCGLGFVKGVTSQVATTPSCSWCKDSLSDLVLALADPSTIQRRAWGHGVEAAITA